MASLQSKNFPPEFSFDGGTTWLTLVCTQDWTHGTAVAVTEDETFCGVETGIGIAKGSGSANATCETAPSSSQVSYELCQTTCVAGTKIKFRIQSPASGTPGTDFYTSYDCYLTAVNQTFATNEVVKFDIAWSSTGVIDVTP